MVEGEFVDRDGIRAMPLAVVVVVAHALVIFCAAVRIRVKLTLIQVRVASCITVLQAVNNCFFFDVFITLAEKVIIDAIIIFLRITDAIYAR